MSSSLPEGLAFRPVRAGDEDAVAELINTYDAQYGTGDVMSAADVRDFWRSLGEEGSADVVEDGGRLVAYVERFPHKGAFSLDGFVHPEHRGRGIGGEILLLTAFAELARRGETRVALGVDAQNPTGATQLYEKAGMHVAFRANVYEKAL